MHAFNVHHIFLIQMVLLTINYVATQLVGDGVGNSIVIRSRDDSSDKCPKFCRFYQLHVTGECNGIFHEATCPATCGETLQEIYDRRKLSLYVLDDWSMNRDWSPLVRGINKRLQERGGKPDLGVAATCELYGKNNYICKSTVLPPPVTQWAREALAVASNDTRKTTSPDLRYFCICSVQCTKGVRVLHQIAKLGIEVCQCPHQFRIEPEPIESLGYNEIYNSTE